MQKHKRTATDIGLALITPIVGQEFLDRYNLRDPLNRSLKYGVKQVSPPQARPPASSSASRASARRRPG